MVIAVDFDGTIVEHKYPKIGKEIPFSVETLKMLQKEGHKLVLWTVREGHLLDEATQWCEAKGLTFYAVNQDYPEQGSESTTCSRKLKADMFIDDRNLGSLPDWGLIYRMIKENLNFEDIYSNNEDLIKKKKKKRWWFR